MSRRVPAIAMLVASTLVSAFAQDVKPAMESNPTAGVASPSQPVPVASPVDSSGTAAAAPAPVVDSTRLTVFPIADSLGLDTSMTLSLFRDVLIQGIIKDSLHQGNVDGWIGTEAKTLVDADSLAAGGRSFVWLQLVPADSGKRRLVAQRRLVSPDSILASIELPFPDSTDLALVDLPTQVLAGLFPGMISAVAPVSLADSIKPVVVLPFLPEGTATANHGTAFTDSLSRLLQGLDGFRVLPSSRRDSLLSGWDPGECLTSSCRREVGERLDVPWIITGHLAQLGEKWTVRAELVRVDSSKSARSAIVQCQGAPAPSLKLASGMTARQLAGKEKPREELSDAPVARTERSPAWARLLALGIASTLGLVGVILSW